MEEERKKEEKKGKLPNCKIPKYMQRFIARIKCVTEYTHIYTHP